MKSLLKNSVLLIVAVVLGVLILPIGFVYTVFLIIKKRNLNKLLGYCSNIIRSIAISIDQFANMVCRDLFNKLLLKKDAYLFGRRDETISSVLGKNFLLMRLTPIGKTLVRILDFFEHEHCINSIQHF